MNIIILFLLILAGCEAGSVIIINEKEDLTLKDIKEVEEIKIDITYGEDIFSEFFEDFSEIFEEDKISTFEEIEKPKCVSNNDGIIENDEIYIFLNSSVSYIVNKEDKVVEVPSIEGSEWDFSKIDPLKEEEVIDFVKSIDEFWFKDKYPSDAYVATLDIRKGDLGVYKKSENSLLLLGLTSIEKGKTNLFYKKPILLLKFPLKNGDSYKTSESEAEGVYDGKVYPQDYGLLGKVQIFHSYEIYVNGEGKVKVPAGEFYVLRLLIELKMEVKNSLNPFPLVVQKFKIYDFISECTGLIARIKSEEGENDIFFKFASEYKRLGFLNE